MNETIEKPTQKGSSPSPVQKNSQESKGIDIKGKESVLKVKQFVLNFLVPLICFGVMILLGIFVLYPTLMALPEIEEELEAKVTLENQLSTKRSALNKLVDFKTVVSENASLVDSVLVSEAMVPELLTQVTQIAQESGFEITKLTYSFSGAASGDASVAASNAPENVMVSLGARGTYDQLLTFLRSVENAARIVDVDTYRYVLDRGEDSSVLEMNFVLTSPYLFVQSSAVTDDPINLDITDPGFVATIDKIKNLRVYRISAEDVVPVSPPEEESETPPEGSPPETPPPAAPEPSEEVVEGSPEGEPPPPLPESPVDASDSAPGVTP